MFSFYRFIVLLYYYYYYYYYTEHKSHYEYFDGVVTVVVKGV